MIVAVSTLGTLRSGSMNPGANLNACCRTRGGASGEDAPSALYCRWALKRASKKKKAWLLQESLPRCRCHS